MLRVFPRNARPRRRSFRPLAECLEVRECPSGGLLDPTFNGGAPETSGFFDWASATAIQPDGKIVVVGRLATDPFHQNSQLAVARFNPDGSPDSSFGSGGATYSASSNTAASGVVLQPDGKTLVCGNATVKTKGVTSYAYLVTRYNANGTLDTSFAKSGVFTWDYSTGNESASKMCLLSDGSILVAGGARGNLPGGSSASVFKLSPTGSLVTSYGTNGLFLVNPGGAGSGASAVALAPNGDLILAGGTHLNTPSGLTDAALLVAVTPAGKLDTGFNGTGYLATEAPGYNVLNFTGVVIQGSSIVVCGGPTGNQLQGGMGGLLARYTLSGALDTTFGAGGYFTTGGAFTFHSLVLEPDGSIVAGGYQTYDAGDVAPYNEMAFVHLTADGALDTSFGTPGTGFVYVQAGAQSDVEDLAITSDGRIFAVGYGYTTGRVACLVRLTSP
jgi:uncharacterized delta-60 repeat protein